MDVALCYESVLPARGGAETYIGDLARRLACDGHAVHLYACRWDASSLPASTHYHRLDVPSGPRFLRPWRFGAACEEALSHNQHDVSIGFDKTWGQDILYPQGGLHAASQYHNLLKCPNALSRFMAQVGKSLDLARYSFSRLERKQYLGAKRPTIVVNSRMVQRHFERFLGIPAEDVHVVYSAIDPLRFAAEDRFLRRQAERDKWGVSADEPVGLFVAMNYRLKGLAPLIEAAAVVPVSRRFRIAVVGHPKVSQYRRLASRLGVAERFLFLGHRQDPRDCYFASDFLVHPTFYDPCSLVALEALACGLPVITSQYNGASELLTVPENGLVVSDPHDRQELGQAIERMTDANYRRSAAVSARQAAARWTFEKHYQSLVRLFQSLRMHRHAA
ncbi:MAG: glycosyltransferase family 4 protein [Bacteroidales bacterium]|nr:glycosyltransferase family 4 protein [Bacteroidales bacterium]